MKYFKTIAMCMLLVLVGISCSDFLDQVPDDRLTVDKTFAQRNTTLDFLANVYSRIPNETQRFVGGTTGPWTAGSDEAEYSYSNYVTNSVNLQAYDATSGWVSGMWSDFYRGIRDATYFMKHADQCSQCDAGNIVRFKAEARGLRAFFYYNLLRDYGPVVIIGNEELPPDATLGEVQLPRTPYDEAVDYVASQLDSAAMNLPDTPINNDYYGRMTKSFLMGVKTDLLLTAASPLFNGNTDYAAMKNPDGTQLISQTTDQNKWKEAADAAKAFIDRYVPGTYSLYRENDSQGNFSPYLSCRDVVLDSWNSEIIYARTNAQVDQYVMKPYHNGAPSEYKGGGGFAPTQTMVDAYFTANGRSIDDPQSGYQETGFSDFQAPYDTQERSTYNEWVNREPRFYVGITYNGSLWLQTDPQQVITKTWYGGNSGQNAGGNDYPHTGYVVRKNKAVVGGNQTIPMMRLAEIYLAYVEALNEYDPGNPDILLYLNKIRDRAGIPGYGDGPDQIPAPEDQNAMRQAIHHERRVELAFENKRYFDVRRWKIAEQTEDGPIYGMDARATPESEFYNKVVIEDRVFNPKGYLLPIPQDEVNIDKNLVQNPGW